MTKIKIALHAATSGVTGLALAALCGLGAQAATFTPDILTKVFTFSGSPESYTVPADVCSVSIEAFGAAGGTSQSEIAGGKGALVEARLAVSPGEVLTINVGGQGGFAEGSTPVPGGYGGGGAAGGFITDGLLEGIQAGSGGGASTVSIAGTPAIIAGGGGGGAGTYWSSIPVGGDGGLTGSDGAAVPGPNEGAPGLSGGNGGRGGENNVIDPNGLDGGSAVGGQGGKGGDSSSDPHGGVGGGGGGGLVGGGGGAASPTPFNSGAGGGGGSSFGPADAVFTTGSRTGNGQVNITNELCLPSAQKIIVDRLGGSDRYGTSAAVNAMQMKAGMPLFVASGEVFADALSAGPAVTSLSGSLVLTKAQGLSPEILALVRDRQPSVVYVIGQTQSVSENVVKQLKATLASSTKIERIGGADRYVTSLDVYQKFLGEAKEIFVTTGATFPDALSAAGVAGAIGSPVVLVNGTVTTTVSTQLRTQMTSAKVSKINVVGGEGTVNAPLVTSLQSIGTTSRYGGSTRYETNLAINAYLDTRSPLRDVDTIWIAAGQGFPDALSGSAVAGSFPQRLYLSPSTTLPVQVQAIIHSEFSAPIRYVHLIGGSNMLSQNVFDLAENL